MIKDLYFMIDKRTKGKNLEFKTEIDPKIPRSLFGDDVRIRQIIINLLTNSVKYTKQGSVTLEIGGVREDDENYIKQLNIYKEYLSLLFDKPIKMYLYSISQNKLKEVN